MQERNRNAALNLAREYYGDKNLKKGDVRPTKLVDFVGIARYHNVNIIPYGIRQGPAQKQLAHDKHGIIGSPLFLHQEDGCTL